MTMSPQDLQTLFSCSCSFSMSPQDLQFRSGRRANDDEPPGLANPISCSFRMSSLSGEEYKCMEPFIAIDGAPSARLPESEAVLCCAADGQSNMCTHVFANVHNPRSFRPILKEGTIGMGNRCGKHTENNGVHSVEHSRVHAPLVF